MRIPLPTIVVASALMTPEHLLLDCQEPHRRHSGPDRHGRGPEIARAGYASVSPKSD